MVQTLAKHKLILPHSMQYKECGKWQATNKYIELAITSVHTEDENRSIFCKLILYQ